MTSMYAHRGYRTLVLVDNVNLYVSCKTAFHGTPDHEKLLLLARAGNPLYRARVYGVRHSDEKMDRWTEAIRATGFEVLEKPVIHRSDGTSKADWDVEICMDAWRMLDQYDMLVLVTGDGDFADLVRRCRKELGKVVRAIGVERSTAQVLIDEVDEFIPFTRDMLLENRNRTVDAVGDDVSLGDAFRHTDDDEAVK